MLKQIFDESECAGKTIQAVKIGWGDMVISFTDGTFAYFAATIDRHSGSDLSIRAPLPLLDFDDDGLIAAGVATREELEAERVRRRNQEDIKSRMRRLADYERLKKEFEA